MSIDLEPCPFCGSEPEIGGRLGGTFIRCPNDQCIISTDVPIPFNDIGHRADAIAAWNTRAPTAAARERDALREALKPFARYLDVLETMGGNTPRSGTYCGVTSSSMGDAEITIEDLQRARQSIAPNAGEPK